MDDDGVIFMRMLQSVSPGGPETLLLAEVPEPKPAEGEVRVRVMTSAINFPDSLIIEDKYQYKPARPFAPGAEVAGVIDAVGPGVTEFREGDRVFSMPGWGGLSEKIVLKAAGCFKLPDTIPFDDGAVLIMTYGTAYHALVQRAGLRPGETVLITGAAGGVGLAAIEVAKALGARVVAAASSEAKLEIARQHGADQTVLYPRGSVEGDAKRALVADFKEACGKGADVVVDCVGGDLTEVALRATAWQGRLLIVGFPAGISKLPTNLLLLKGASAIGVFYGSFTELEPEQDRKNMQALLDLYIVGKIKPHIAKRFPLEQGGKAISALLETDASGKIVVDVGG